MSFNIRIPNITATSTPEQIRQVHSYLYQVVEQLNWALNSISTANVSENANIIANTSNRPSTNTTTSQENDSVNTFNSIKGLIIKSADIVNAYYEEIDNLLKLSGEYVAESDFGTFKQTTNLAVQANSDNISLLFDNMQKVTTDVESVIDVNAYIKPGLLYYDTEGVPIYGLEIGQKTKIDGEEVFNKYARFTANKLSFYDNNGYEAAYISDKKLYIDNVEINISFTMGGFQETVIATGTVTKWIGGS